MTWRQIADPSPYTISVSPFAPLTILRVKQHRVARLDLSGPGADPRAPVEPPEEDYRITYFPETRHQMSELFLSVLLGRFGNATLFGPPISEEFVEVNATDGQRYLVQYFSTARMEYHPVPDTPDGSMLVLGMIGSELTADRRAAGEASFVPVADPQQPDVRYFPETGHTLSGAFLRYWVDHGQIERLGNPISEPLVETIGSWTGSVQYFERARIELRGDGVRLGELGAELLNRRVIGDGQP